VDIDGLGPAKAEDLFEVNTLMLTALDFIAQSIKSSRAYV
jgi:hypothetical protein